MRQRWAEAWSQWLAPGGELVTVMFPVEPEGREGPPWPVPLQLYDDTLSPAGGKRASIYSSSESVVLLINELFADWRCFLFAAMKV